jgi:hypothetical protein
MRAWGYSRSCVRVVDGIVHVFTRRQSCSSRARSNLVPFSWSNSVSKLDCLITVSLLLCPRSPSRFARLALIFIPTFVPVTQLLMPFLAQILNVILNEFCPSTVVAVSK